jgi:hypothetical protein
LWQDTFMWFPNTFQNYRVAHSLLETPHNLQIQMNFISLQTNKKPIHPNPNEVLL